MTYDTDAREKAARVLAHYGEGHWPDVSADRSVRYGIHWHALRRTEPGSPERDAVDEAWTWFQAHDTALREELGES